MADVDMPDAPVEGGGQPSSPNPQESIEVEPTVKDEDAMEEGSDHNANEAHDVGVDERPVSLNQYKAFKDIADVLTDFNVGKGDEDYYPSLLFRRLPNKRNLPEYYTVIHEPSAISTLKGKIQRKQYTGVPEFVRDFALIVHNAQVFNRPNSQPVKDVFQLETVFKAELDKLVQSGLAKKEEIEFPDLGPIPAATPEPDPVSDADAEDEDGDEEGEDDEDDDDGDDSDDDRRKKRGRRGGRMSISGRKPGREDDEEGGKGADADSRKRRGRPPKVDTPNEARIKAVIKALRKPKDEDGNFRIRHFEKLPDKAEHPHYYQEIKEPIALDAIKKKSKRKKYGSIDVFMKDVVLMFNNAMAYNEDSSVIYQDAVALLAEAKELAEAEMKKPDDEYLMEDGRLPLPDGIMYREEMWKVGDWIHIQNPNDVTKPIVAQIYRTWQDGEGSKWINACWYYFPEQTVHQYEKHFFPDEVVKTGQYRDHRIDEVVGRCFVMFFTRFNRGRPRGFDSERNKVYVCEARYNEEKHKFNKIKTWASCLPDEVRDKDYEMDMWPSPQKIKKVPSPLLHLLKDDTKETDEIPLPQWGNKNAPPIVGAIHKHPRDENQSPPPEPTPPPPTPPPPPPVRQISTNIIPHHQSRPSMDRTSNSGQGGPPQIIPQATNPQVTSASPAPQYGRQQSYQQQMSTNPSTATPQIPTAQPQSTPYVAQQQLHAPPSLSAAHQTSYPNATPSQGFGRGPVGQGQQQPTYPVYPGTNVHEPRATEVWVLSEAANASIPKETRDRYPQDQYGRVLFFSHPPVDTRHVITGGQGQPLQHSEEYLKAKAARLARVRQLKAKHLAKMERDGKAFRVAISAPASPDPNGGVRYVTEEPATDDHAADGTTDSTEVTHESEMQRILNEKIERAKEYLVLFEKNYAKDMAAIYLAKYGTVERAVEYYELDMNLTARRNERERLQDAKDKELEAKYNFEATPIRMDQNFWTGRYPDGTGRFEDDFDNRLPK